jgi:hypothetical protein
VNWDLVVRLLRAVDDGADVVADCGSVYGDLARMPRAAWAGADLVVLTVRPTLAGVHAARNAAAILREDLMTSGLGTDRLVSVVVGCPYGYPLSQVVDELEDCAPVVGDLPFDPDAADTLGGLRDQRARFGRSALLRHAGKLAASIGSRVLDGSVGAETARAAVPPAPPGAPAGSLDKTGAPATRSAPTDASAHVPATGLPEWRVVPVSPPPPVPHTADGATRSTATGGNR